MATCPSCFTERSDTGACFCEDPPALVVKGPVKFTLDDESTKDDTVLKTSLPKSVTFDIELKDVDQELMDLLTDTPMSDAEVVRTARALLDEHGLKNVRITWTQAANTLGQCRFFKGYGATPPRAYELRFSRKVFPHLSRSEQMQVITHEVAHAITPGHGHDAVWRSQHRSMGGNAQTCANLSEEVLKATRKWRGECPNGHVQYRAQKSAKMYRVSCGRCSRRFNPAFMIKWEAQW